MVHVRLEETKRPNWYRVVVFGRRIADARREPSGLFHVKPLETQFVATDRLERLMNEEDIEALAMRSKLVTERRGR